MIRVNDDYIIDVDAYNYTVKRDLHNRRTRIDKKTGKEIEIDLYSTVGYYGSLTEAIKGIIADMNRRELTTGVRTLLEAVDIVLKNNRYVSELLERALEV